MSKQPAGLIRVLLDDEGEFGDRQDAAMDLAAFDDEAVEQALAQVACNQSVNEDLADACGESLADIWCRRNRLSQHVLAALAPASLRIALATLQACSPTLAAEAQGIVRSSE